MGCPLVITPALLSFAFVALLCCRRLLLVLPLICLRESSSPLLSSYIIQVFGGIICIIMHSPGTATFVALVFHARVRLPSLHISTAEFLTRSILSLSFPVLLSYVDWFAPPFCCLHSSRIAMAFSLTHKAPSLNEGSFFAGAGAV